MNTTTIFPAREAKNNFGRMLDVAQSRPVTIQKKGRNVAVVLSYETYERLEAMDDAYWVTRTQEAMRDDRHSATESVAFLQNLASTAHGSPKG